jgi:hypothetical protein
MPGPAIERICDPLPEVTPPLMVKPLPPVFATCEIVSGSSMMTGPEKIPLASANPPME